MFLHEIEVLRVHKMVLQESEMVQQKNEMVLRKQEGATLISGIRVQNKQWSADHWKVEL